MLDAQQREALMRRDRIDHLPHATQRAALEGHASEVREGAKVALVALQRLHRRARLAFERRHGMDCVGHYAADVVTKLAKERQRALRLRRRAGPTRSPALAKGSASPLKSVGSTSPLRYVGIQEEQVLERGRLRLARDAGQARCRRRLHLLPARIEG